MEKWTVSRDDSVYEAWPDVVKTPSGKLICIFTECAHHLKREQVRLVTAESTDRGRTWSRKRAFTDVCVGDFTWNNARITALPDGRLAACCDLTAHDSDGTVYLWFADPEGERWEGSIETPVKGIVPNKLLELPNGRWILAAHRKDAELGKLVVYSRYSDDKGKTWSEEAIVGRDERYNLCEPTILVLSDGSLVAMMRENSGMGYDGQKSISRDNGETWEGVYPLALCGCHRPVATRLHSGRILITYRFAHGAGPWGCWTQNFMAALTDEESCREPERKKQRMRIIPIDYDRNEKADIGYSGVAQFDDGEIYIVNYIMDDSVNSQIRGYSLREDELIL